MELSYKILSVHGIAIELHAFFLLFILLLLFLNPLFSVLMIVAFFFVTLHELAHSLVAIRNHMKIKKIVLLPIGGMAVVEERDIKPLTEIKIAVAGPLLNFVFVYLCLLIAAVLNLPLNDWIAAFTADPSFFPGIGETLLLYAFYTNYMLGFFNLIIPAFPLDGGRILRALLAVRADYIKATFVAKTVSLGITAFLFVVGLLGQNIMLMIIALFIGFGATAEYDVAVMHRALRRVTVADVLTKKYLAIRRGESVMAAVKKMSHARQFSALCDDRIVELTALAAVPHDKWRKDAAYRSGIKASTTPHALAEHASKMMTELGIGMMPVYHEGQLVGVVYKFEINKAAKIAEIISTDGRKI